MLQHATTMVTQSQAYLQNKFWYPSPLKWLPIPHFKSFRALLRFYPTSNFYQSSTSLVAPSPFLAPFLYNTRPIPIQKLKSQNTSAHAFRPLPNRIPTTPLDPIQSRRLLPPSLYPRHNQRPTSHPAYLPHLP